jgi:hypothetical protein
LLYALPAAATTSTLTENEVLIPGRRLVSRSCAFHVDMQTARNPTGAYVDSNPTTY